MSILRKMSSIEFENYIDNAVKSYAKEKIESGNWTEDDKLLPNGVNSNNNYLFSILNEIDKVIGMIWLNVKENNLGFIYDLNIYKEYQGKGYGLKAMEEIENIARSLKLEKIELHVFGHNTKAINLYEKLNYKKTNIIMNKKL
ncbi:N-acetyltransferase GCN5 [[Clostridium] sordellii]|uniref:Acetyltransferase n=1 Tax=Paraclostridium sordellii TaxID=1505 RepID=A0ABM9RNM6_PARSO|nr:GNAT family N-acetyltransferase [Paeniclostridium sordellii]EPZ57348.1 acetyltransferase family protein [[Clostridium] sordellii ATCC 9714] [Paeniclostridium sordellii ATCC 9714]CEJ73559.1 putative acetyltransferase [[Clostridium] sordellii] [Paeniclostridium sordellii]CEN69109.1 N-acetyltransferase GCN5 [[Clostridium] sordellii] [Paeniclostridium sordellii]CEN72377.1 N-acetyltransferase GCN5 [[Clostridium] sordellii] [Paeniclostridium sordellii]CEO23756.1 N-acetyltransferase GCN5 [[Clostri